MDDLIVVPFSDPKFRRARFYRHDVFNTLNIQYLMERLNIYSEDNPPESTAVDVGEYTEVVLSPYTVTAKTDDYVVQIGDFGISKALSMNNANDKTFTLPSVDVSFIGLGLTFIKLGAGKVTIDAADADTIGDSSAGGTVFNPVAGETYATVTILLVSATQWAIKAYHGSWLTT